MRAVARGCVALALACGVPWGAGTVARADQLRLPEGPGADLVYARCRTCHDLQYVLDAKGLHAAQWRAVLAGMKDYGLQLDAHDEERVLAYLTTYLGPNPPPVAAAPRPAAGADGRIVFERNCAGCHGADGRGRAGYYPPLAGNPDLARDVAFPVLVVLHGLAGAIEVGGTAYDAVMPAFDQLSDAEVAAVVNYVRSAWGNARASPPGSSTPEAVAARRARPMTPASVHDYRSAMNAGAPVRQ